MRTTLTIDDDVFDQARALSEKLRTPFRRVVSEAMRVGLREVSHAAAVKPYRTVGHPMGLRSAYDIDNIQEVLAVAEGEDAR